MEAPPVPRILQRPETVDGTRIFSSNLTVVLLFHLLSLLALVPALFTWTGVALVFLGNFVFGTLGINLGYHRLLTHRSFRCPKCLERVLAVLGICSLQDSPVRWVVTHRLHHQHSDDRPDPHSPLVSFFWGHLGWILQKNRWLRKRRTVAKYAKDLAEDPFFARLERNRVWLWVYLAHVVLFFACGWLAGLLVTNTREDALWFGLSVFVWGVIVRTVYVWHITWAVNSVTHCWGYRNYETGDNSRNNWLVALLTNGEGWHNNHHASQRSARHGHNWWELDLTYSTILLLQAVGLVTDVVPASVPEKLKTVSNEPGVQRARAERSDRDSRSILDSPEGEESFRSAAA
jgi:stearoyl-CoA desaturase (delta-9 desaturase)